MTAPHLRQADAAEVDAARLLLAQLGVTAEELLRTLVLPGFVRPSPRHAEDHH